VAVAELDGPEVALAGVDRLEEKLAGYHAFHATRADLLRRLGCSQKSRAAYAKAIELAGNTAETAYLTRRRDQLGSSLAISRPSDTAAGASVRDCHPTPPRGSFVVVVGAVAVAYCGRPVGR
jgi:hypothetical protein